MSDMPSENSHHSADQTELEKLIRNSKPWFEQNATTLIYALAALLAVAAVWVYVNRTPAGNVVASKDLLLAVSPEDFGDVADSFPGTQIGTWSRLRQADRLLDDAVTNMFKDRERGLEDLDRAGAAYERLATRTDLSDEIRERVLIGMARLAEVRSNGNQESTDAAVAAWQRVLDEFSESIVKDHAESRIAKLPTEESKSFYKWFSEQNPKPALTGLAPGQPDVPSVPSITIPDLSGSKEEMPVEETKSEAPAEAKENPDEAKPADTKADTESKPEAAEPKAASEKKPVEKKAADAKPVEKKPAEKKAATEKAADKPADDAKKSAEKKPEAKKPAAEPKPPEKERVEPKVDPAEPKLQDADK